MAGSTVISGLKSNDDKVPYFRIQGMGNDRQVTFTCYETRLVDELGVSMTRCFTVSIQCLRAGPFAFPSRSVPPNMKVRLVCSRAIFPK